MGKIFLLGLYLLLWCDWIMAGQCPSNQIVNFPYQANYVDDIQIDALELKSEHSILHFSGDVQLLHQQYRLFSPNLFYERESSRIYSNPLEKQILLYPGFQLKGSNLNYYPEQSEGELSNIEYYLQLKNARGKANKVKLKNNIQYLEQATFTSCAKTNESWQIEADKAIIDVDIAVAKVYNVKFFIQQLPVFYTPYLEFPLDERRKTGLLLPHLNINSKNGVDLSLPYYVNLSNNYDLTITPRIMSKNGLLLALEYRYLGENNLLNFQGEIIEDLQNVKINEPSEISQLGERPEQKLRGQLAINHLWQISPEVSSVFDYNYVADKYYFNDFSNQNNSISDHLNREWSIRYQNESLQGILRWQTFQNLRLNSHSYSRLPQLAINYQQISNNSWQYGLTAEAVAFHSNPDNNQKLLEANRYYLKPFISYNFHRPAFSVQPKVSWDWLYYQIKNEDSNPGRNTPIVSLDSILHFERQSSFFNQLYVQTLEPRLYYLYVPYREQQQFPLFDTQPAAINLEQLLRENRYTGFDRQSDANQLVAVLSSRLIDFNGEQKFSGSLAYVKQLQAQRVGLTSIENQDKQDRWLLDISNQFFSGIKQQLSIYYKTSTRDIEQIYSHIQAENAQARVNLSFYKRFADQYQLENIEQFDLSADVKLNHNWRMLGRINYLRDTRYARDITLGFEYDSCCYGLRLAFSREKNYVNAQADNRLMLQFNFKGLSSIGNIGLNAMREKIEAYQADF